MRQWLRFVRIDIPKAPTEANHTSPAHRAGDKNDTNFKALKERSNDCFLPAEKLAP